MASHEGVIRWLGVPLMSFMSFPQALGVSPPISPSHAGSAAPAPAVSAEAPPVPALEPGDLRHCRRVSEELSQCALFDGVDESTLSGLEYRLTPRGWLKLPESERSQWVPRNGHFIRVLSLRAPAPRRLERGRGA